MVVKEEDVVVGSALWDSVTDGGTCEFPKEGRIIDDGEVVGVIKYNVIW